MDKQPRKIILVDLFSVKGLNLKETIGSRPSLSRVIPSPCEVIFYLENHFISIVMVSL